MSFLLIVGTKTYQKVVNPFFPRLLSILSLIPLALLILIDKIYLYFIFSLGIILIGFFYIIYFQYRLIFLATGKIKRRLKLILFGQLLIAGSVVIGIREIRQIVYQQFELIAIILSIPLLLSGLLFIYLGVFKFPAFLEFDWREYLNKLLIINQNNQNQIYMFDFRKFFKQTDFIEIPDSLQIKKEKMIPKAIIGTGDVINTIIKAKKSKTTKIKQGNLSIVLDYGDNAPFLIFALIIHKEMKSYQYFLSLIKRQFEGFYKEILNEYHQIEGKEQKLFSSFDLIIQNIIH